MHMVFSHVIPALIVSKVLLTWMSILIKESSFYLITRMKISYFRTSGSLHLYFTTSAVASSTPVDASTTSAASSYSIIIGDNGLDILEALFATATIAAGHLTAGGTPWVDRVS